MKPIDDLWKTFLKNKPPGIIYDQRIMPMAEAFFKAGAGRMFSFLEEILEKPEEEVDAIYDWIYGELMEMSHPQLMKRKQ